MSERPPATPGDNSEAVPVTPRPSGRLVDPALLHVDPTLLGQPLAAPWQRALAMTVDLVVVAFLSLLTGPVLGFLTGVTLAALGGSKAGRGRFWQWFRWGPLLLGLAVALLSLFLLLDRPLLRTAAFNLGELPAAPEQAAVHLSPSPPPGELRRAVNTLQRQNAELREENTRLRESARGNSLLNTVTDSSRTLGLTFGWAGVYFTLGTAILRGRTVGKALCRIRVVRLDGRPLSAMDAFTRNGGYAAGLATGSIGFLRLMWDPNRQAIQDKIAATVVVSTRSPRSNAA